MFGILVDKMLNPGEVDVYAMLSTGFASDFMVRTMVIGLITFILSAGFYNLLVREGPALVGKRSSQVMAVITIVFSFPLSVLFFPAMTPEGFFREKREGAPARKPRNLKASRIVLASTIGIIFVSQVAMVSLVGTISLNNGKRMIAGIDRSIAANGGGIREGIFPSEGDVAVGPRSISWIEKDQGRSQKKMAYLISSEKLWSKVMDITPVDLDGDAYEWFVDLRKNVAIADFEGNKIACVYSNNALSAVLPSKLMFGTNALRYEGLAYLKNACPAEVDNEAERVAPPSFENVFQTEKSA